jgi:predicted transposase/invertase (TIGR01784 family)
MKTDSLFYAMFQALPEVLFALLGKSLSSEDIRAARQYSFQSVEVKGLSFRLDGILALPNFAETFFVVEVQYKRDTKFYSRLFAEIMLFLRDVQPQGNWQALVVFPDRSADAGVPVHYSDFLTTGRLAVIYLNELPKDSIASYPLNIIQLIESSLTEEDFMLKARSIVETATPMFELPSEQKALENLVINIVLAKFSNLTFEEIT